MLIQEIEVTSGPVKHVDDLLFLLSVQKKKKKEDKEDRRKRTYRKSMLMVSCSDLASKIWNRVVSNRFTEK